MESLSIFGAMLGLGNLNIQILKLIVIIISCYGLYTGRAWAKRLITVIAAFSLFQGIMAVVTGVAILFAGYFLAIIVGFSLILWYINKSKEFDDYLILIRNGARLSKGNFQSIEKFIDENQIIEVDHKSINTPEAYKVLTQQLINLMDLGDQAIKIEATSGEVFIQSSEEDYEISYSDRIAIFDMNFLKRLNKSITNQKPHHSFHIIHPESIIKPSNSPIYIAYLNEEQYILAKTNGYLKE